MIFDGYLRTADIGKKITAIGVGISTRDSQVGSVVTAFGLGIQLGTALQIPFIMETTTIVDTTVDLVGIPTVGRLPYFTSAVVELNPREIPTAKVDFDIPTLGKAEPFAPPVIHKAQLKFDNNSQLVIAEALVTLTGSNFLNDTDDLGSDFEDLIVNFRMGGKTYSGTVLPALSKRLGDHQYVGLTH